MDLLVAEGKLTLHVRGADKLWAFKSSLEIPLVHIAGVGADPEAARGWYHGIRMPGTNLPGVITAGTFYQDGKRVFWDVHHPEKIIVEVAIVEVATGELATVPATTVPRPPCRERVVERFQMEPSMRSAVILPRSTPG